MPFPVAAGRRAAGTAGASGTGTGVLGEAGVCGASSGQSLTDTAGASGTGTGVLGEGGVCGTGTGVLGEGGVCGASSEELVADIGLGMLAVVEAGSQLLVVASRTGPELSAVACTSVGPGFVQAPEERPTGWLFI
jgi:hypothetical protein